MGSLWKASRFENLGVRINITQEFVGALRSAGTLLPCEIIWQTLFV